MKRDKILSSLFSEVSFVLKELRVPHYSSLTTRIEIQLDKFPYLSKFS